MEGEERKFQKADTSTVTRHVKTSWRGQQRVSLKTANTRHTVQLDNHVDGQDVGADTLVQTPKVVVAAAIDISTESGR